MQTVIFNKVSISKGGGGGEMVRINSFGVISCLNFILLSIHSSKRPAQDNIQVWIGKLGEECKIQSSCVVQITYKCVGGRGSFITLTHTHTPS